MARGKSDGGGGGWGVLLGVAVGALALGAIAGAHDKEQRRKWLHAFQGRVRQAAAHLGTEAPPVIEDLRIANAASNGAVILVNTRWVGTTIERYCNSLVCQTAVLLGVAAHELGHHVNGHAIHGGDSHSNEREADQIAGRVLRLAQVPSDNFERIINELAGYLASATHPAGPDRVAAIRRGFNGAGGYFFV